MARSHRVPVAPASPAGALYRVMLLLCPASFRAEYGSEMAAVFEEKLRRSPNTWASLLLMLEAFADTLATALRVHADLLSQDLRYAWRTWRRSPGFPLTVILVAGLGVGANTAVFTVADHVMLRPLPYPDSNRLVKLWESPPGYTQMELSPPNYRDWKEMNRSVEAMGAYYGTNANLVGSGVPEHLTGARVTEEILSIVGVRPVMGRVFTAEDDTPASPPTVVLSYGIWQASLGGDSAVVGKPILLDGVAHEVIGVLPRDFHYPSNETEYWVPLRLAPDDYEDRDNNCLNVLARLKAGVTVEQARDDFSRIASQLESEYPAENARTGSAVVPLQDEISGQSRLLLYALLGAAFCVLLIACTNLANLMLARALARQKEVALRSALGAGRERLVRQMFTESVSLAVIGGALGVLLAYAALPALNTLVPPSIPISPPTIDFRVLCFTGVLVALTALGFGVYPALRGAASAAAEGMREGARSGVGGRREGVRSVLVIVEVTLSVVLLVAAGLLLEALWQLRGTHPGFRTEGVLTLRTALPMPRYESSIRRQQFYTNVVSEIQAIPGISTAAYISFLPMVMRGGIWPVGIDGRTYQREANHTASLRYVTPGFFETMAIPILAGRDITEADHQETTPVAVVSASFAKRYWPDTDPLGRQFEIAFQPRTVVGIAGNIRVRGMEQESEPQVYLPAPQTPDGALTFYAPKDLVICCVSTPGPVLPAIRQIIQRADPEQAVSDVRMLGDIVDSDTSSRAVQLVVLGTFAAVAFLLAGVGIHGLLSFTIARRTQEIGVRMALGAQSADILRMVMAESGKLAGVGVLLGVGLGFAAGRSMEALLAGIPPASPLTFSAAITFALTMAIAGTLLPALRAVRVSPTDVIREQ